MSYVLLPFVAVVYDVWSLTTVRNRLQLGSSIEIQMAGYYRQTFLDTARRRVREAESLLSVPKVRSCDGAVACALLASECALKALLLFGYNADEDEELPPQIMRSLFGTAKGHEIQRLWENVTPRCQSLIPRGASFRAALAALDQAHRYEHRYGKQRPAELEASRLVEYAKTLCLCVSEVLPS